MRKLIELDVALDALRKVIVPAEDIGFGDESTDGYNDGIDMAVTVVSGLPTVDAVEAVQCRDCKHCQYDSIFGSYWCGGRLGGIEIEADFFCKDGERKDGDNG